MPRESFHIWQYLNTAAYAALVAEIAERMTGDACYVEALNCYRFRVLRYTPEGKTVIA